MRARVDTPGEGLYEREGSGIPQRTHRGPLRYTKCIHSRNCVLGRPDVFVPNAPGGWIHPEKVVTGTGRTILRTQTAPLCRCCDVRTRPTATAVTTRSASRPRPRDAGSAESGMSQLDENSQTEMDMGETYTLGYSDTALDFVSRRTLESHGAFFIPYLHPGMRVLDCGCGPGSITFGHRRSGWHGSVVGVDMDESQVRLATANAAAREATNVSFRTGNAYALPFADGSFDAVFSHALLEHLSQPVKGSAGIPARTATRGRDGCVRPRLGRLSLFAADRGNLCGATRAQRHPEPKRGRYPRRAQAVGADAGGRLYRHKGAGALPELR